MATLPIHPFPARMAPDIALAQCCLLESGATVLDPMAGSGTVLRAAAAQGLIGIGFDVDPLAVLMTGVWTMPIDTMRLRAQIRELVTQAEALTSDEALLPWIDDDPATREYVDYWFGPVQQADLRRLSYVLFRMEGPVADALRVALSRLIITKDRGASLGRDVSHSRPHRVMDENDFPVMHEFARSAERLACRLESEPPPGNVRVGIGDARDLGVIEDKSIDAVITSPPYLNAIDYIRGHRLSLVWLGHQVGDLRMIRSDSIGAERAPDPKDLNSMARELVPALGEQDALPPKMGRMIDRYVNDLFRVMRESRRVLKPGGRAAFVIGNSCLRGVFIDNAAVVASAAASVGLVLIERNERELPPSKRYLPPPVSERISELAKRMRTEVVLTFSG